MLNNAANTRFAAGSADEALALYERAARANPSPLVLFNLAQAYGRAILLEEQDLALAQAQALDPRAVHALTQHVAEVGGGGPVDVAVSAATLRARGAGREVRRRRSLARRFAPGWLGASWLGGSSPGSASRSLAGAAAGAAGAAPRGGRRPLRRASPGCSRAARRPTRRSAWRASAPSAPARRASRACAGSRPGSCPAPPPSRRARGCSASSRRSSRRPPGPRLRARGGLVPDPLTAGPDRGASCFGALALLAGARLRRRQALSLALLRRRR